MKRLDVPPVILEIQKDVMDFLNPKALPFAGSPNADGPPPVLRTDLTSLVEAREAVAICSAELDALQREAKARIEEQTRRTVRDEAALKRLKRERDELAEEGATKCRKVDATEQDANHLRIEADTLQGEVEDLQNAQQRKRKAAERRFEEESRTLSREIDDLRKKIDVAPGLAKSALSSEEEALSARVAELERANQSLRVICDHQTSGSALEVRLKEAQRAHTDELKEAQRARRKLTSLQEKVQRLRQDAATFQACLDERDQMLEKLEGSARRAEKDRKDVAAFRRAVEPIVGPKKEPTCLNLKEKWAQTQAQVEESERQKKSMQDEIQDLQNRRKKAEDQAAKYRSEEHKVQRLVEERSKKLCEHLDQHAQAVAVISVLQQVCDNSSSSSGTAITAFEVAGDQGSKYGEDAGKGEREKELEQLRVENAGLVEAAQRTVGLQHIHDDLKAAITEVKNEVEAMEAKLMEPQPSLEKSNATELKQEHRSLKDEIQRLEASLKAIGTNAGSEENLEVLRLEAEQQLTRYKRATKQNIQDFREGVYLLLGWKVDQRGSGADVRWHLTSKYQKDKELAFGRSESSGGSGGVDLLVTNWAEELQRSPEAMAFLEKRSSVPGFLAHLTHECLVQSTLPP